MRRFTQPFSRFEKHMDEVNGKKTLLQNEITRLNTEMGNVKIRTVNQPPLDKPAIHGNFCHLSLLCQPLPRGFRATNVN